jgi:hypothetical protein
MQKELRLLAPICGAVFLTALGIAQNISTQTTAILPSSAKVKVDFARDIEPILKDRCQSCHGSAVQSGGLRLDSRAGAMAGGNSGAVIKPGDSAGSKLIQLVAGANKDLVMPLTGARLTAEQVGVLRAWIDQGADWPGSAALEPQTAQGSKPRVKSSHWAFAAPVRPNIPPVGNSAWVRNPIDSFVLAKLESEKIAPSKEADRNTLIRRLSLDLIGLPPTPDELDQFLSDNRPDAYERLVDRLLVSPHYGEKWARPWLDLAHYADSDGYEKDMPRPYAWRYRQWVIDALNQNMPFDEFTIEQLAGDLLPHATLDQKVATGFLRNTLTNREGGVSSEEFRVEQAEDRADTVGIAWLGLTVGCARCHDHKFDPISQRDHYQLFAFFNSIKEVNLDYPAPGEMGVYLRRKPEYDKKRKALLEEYKAPEVELDWEKHLLTAADHPGIDVPADIGWDTVGKMVDNGQEILRLDPSKRTPKQENRLVDHFVQYYSIAGGDKRYEELKFKELAEKLQKLEDEYPELTEAPTVIDGPTPRETHVLIRGDYKQPGIKVDPDTLSVLPPPPPGSPPTRLTLARWLVSKDNPLTARVIVNRMWQEFFGQGLVESSEDFGTRGDRPTHPELLDWLACEFMEHNWDVKRMHKLIVMSATYRQASTIRKELEASDPYNKLLARQSRVRLTAELIRDETLAAGGLLNTTIGGPSIHPELPPGVVSLGFGNFVKWQDSEGAARYRRGLYIFFQRSVPYPELMNFNAPDSLLVCTRRERTTTPLQALNLLNDPVFMEAAQGMAARVLRENRGGVNDRIEYAYELSLARKPSPREKDSLVKYYEQQKDILAREPDAAGALFPTKSLEGVDASEAATWVGLSSVLLNLDEFITRE